MTGAPRLNLPLVLEAPDRTDDGLGGHRLSWRALGRIWGRIERGSGREGRGQVGPESQIGLKITIRAYPQGDLRRPVAGQRLTHGARIFRIEAVCERGADGRWLSCVVQEEMPS